MSAILLWVRVPSIWKPWGWGAKAEEEALLRSAKGLGLLLFSASEPLNMLLFLADVQFPSFTPNSHPW